MSGERYIFEQWTLDCRRGALTGARGEIALRPKTFEVLRFLVENAGRLVSRNEILDTVWPNVTVTEESLTHCVSEIRQALDDTDQRIIKTVPRRGYLFAAAVNGGAGEDGKAGAEPAGNEPSPAADADLAPSAERSLREPSVAVLPFANLSGDPAQEYLSDGFTEDIINGLSYFSELSVIARNSSFSFKGRAIDVRVVGRELGVGYVVEGSVRRFGDRIRITAQLVDTRSGIRRWAERFDRTVGEIFAVQDEITQSIVRIAVAHLGHAERERVLEKPASSWTAYDLVLRGDEALRANRVSWDPDKLREARRLYAEALKLDPDNAAIYAKLAFCYVRAYHYPPDPELGDPNLLKHGHDLAERAVGLDPNLPLARANLGWALLWMRRHDAAIQEYEKAFALNPNFSDPIFGGVLLYAGEASSALGFVQDHLRLDPFHPPHLHGIQGNALYMLRRYREAVTPLSECIRRSPNSFLGRLWLAATLVRLGEGEEARTVAAELLRRWPRIALWLALMPYRNPQDAEHITEALREAGIS
jgi:TolB-like protein/tetratricopeptide (TPR) repeat protein